jgi:hypothetical protein
LDELHDVDSTFTECIFRAIDEINTTATEVTCLSQLDVGSHKKAHTIAGNQISIAQQKTGPMVGIATQQNSTIVCGQVEFLDDVLQEAAAGGHESLVWMLLANDASFPFMDYWW